MIGCCSIGGWASPPISLIIKEIEGVSEAGLLGLLFSLWVNGGGTPQCSAKREDKPQQAQQPTIYLFLSSINPLFCNGNGREVKVDLKKESKWRSKQFSKRIGGGCGRGKSTINNQQPPTQSNQKSLICLIGLVDWLSWFVEFALPPPI